MEFKTKECSAAFWPHGRHDVGPWDLRLGKRTQVGVMATWPLDRKVFFSLDQPDEETNLTFLRVLFLNPGMRTPEVAGDGPFHKAKLHREGEASRRVVVKTRYVRNPKHPIPMGQYRGHIFYNDRAAVITLQTGGTISKEKPVEPKRNILIPGDEGFNESFRDATKTLHRTYGLGG